MDKNYETEKAIEGFRNIRRMLGGLPREIWDIFLPGDEKDLINLEAALIEWRKFEDTRQKVMAIQQLCGLPLRPNMTLNEAQAMARLKGMKKSRLLDEMRRNSGEDDDNEMMN